MSDDAARWPAETIFGAPWEAQAFAMAVTLHERGVFTWTEWADTLAAQIGDAQARGEADEGDTYYRHWLAALETLVARHGLAADGELDRYRKAWEHAAARTPHGQPIELAARDLTTTASHRDPHRTGHGCSASSSNA